MLAMQVPGRLLIFRTRFSVFPINAVSLHDVAVLFFLTFHIL
jgi:hypothetical protein